jgi:hypothetical protein
VAVFASHDLHPITSTVIAPDAAVVAFEFLDEDEALATDGTRLLHVRLAAGRVRPLDLGQLPGPITRLAVSADRNLVAVACGTAVRVLRRR